MYIHIYVYIYIHSHTYIQIHTNRFGICMSHNFSAKNAGDKGIFPAVPSRPKWHRGESPNQPRGMKPKIVHE